MLFSLVFLGGSNQNNFRRRARWRQGNFRENRKKEKVGRPSLLNGDNEFIYFFFTIGDRVKGCGKMAITIPFLKNMLKFCWEAINKLPLLKLTPTAIDTSAIKELCCYLWNLHAEHLYPLKWCHEPEWVNGSLPHQWLDSWTLWKQSNLKCVLNNRMSLLRSRLA